MNQLVSLSSRPHASRTFIARLWRRARWKLRSSTRLQGLAGIFITLVLVAVWTTVAVMLTSERRNALSAQIRQNANIAQVLQEQTVRVISAVDQVLLRAARVAAAGPVDQRDYQRLVDSTGLSAGILAQLSLIDASGHFVGSNIDPGGRKTGAVDLSNREHVRIHLAPAGVGASAGQVLTADGLFIGRPVLGKVSQKWTIQFSRLARNKDGKPVGVVVASIDPVYFEEVYRQVGLGQQGGVALVGADSIIRTRVIGGQPSGMGDSLGAAARIEKEKLTVEGTWTGSSAYDRVERAVAYHRAGTYPLYVFVLASVDEALAQWRSTRNLIVSLAGLLSVVVCGSGLVFLLGVRRLESQHRALVLSEAQARSANQTKSEFLAAISHELRTPLTSIRGYAELMEHRGSDARFRAQASSIRKASEHLNSLLSEILDLAKVDSGALQLYNRDHRLEDIVDATVALFRGSAEDKQLALVLAVAPSAPAVIRGDEQRLRQILNNLLSNAIKFTRSGRVDVRVDYGAEYWSFQVIDTGPGIPAHLHDAIFEKFRQADARVSYEHGGTGLGLALSRSLALRMGGNVIVESAPGVGSTFTFLLPIEQTLYSGTGMDNLALV